MWADLRKAGETVSFGFSDPVAKAFKNLDDCLTALLMTKVDTLTDPREAPHRPNFVREAFDSHRAALNICEKAKKDFAEACRADQLG